MTAIYSGGRWINRQHSGFEITDGYSWNGLGIKNKCPCFCRYCWTWRTLVGVKHVAWQDVHIVCKSRCWRKWISQNWLNNETNKETYKRVHYLTYISNCNNPPCNAQSHNCYVIHFIELEFPWAIFFQNITLMYKVTRHIPTRMIILC